MYVSLSNLRKDLACVRETYRLRLLNVFSENRLDDAINDRAYVQDALKRGVLPDGSVRVIENSIDCDHCSGQYVHKLAGPSFLLYQKLYREVCRGAEGPFSLTVLPADEDVPEFESRDYVLEAFEDGHPHSVSY